MNKLPLAIPAVVTLLCVMITIRVVGTPMPDVYVESAPTAYSNDHAIAQARAQDEEPVATF